MPGKANILLAGDSAQDLNIHATTLQGQGYDVVMVHSWKEVEQILAHSTPDLVLVEVRMKGMDGFGLCTMLKKRTAMTNVPVIFITDTRSPELIDRIYGVGAVDFIVKPCPLSEFLARIETQIHLHNLLLKVERLTTIAIDANPLTHLPGNNTIVVTIQEAIDQGRDMALIYTDLDNFKAYNDAYGFSAGDDLLLFTANTLQDVLRLACGDEGFLGHIGGDDFVMMMPSHLLDKVGEEVLRVFDEGVPEFYSDEDCRRGGIVAVDRAGKSTDYPLVSISLAGIKLGNHKFTRYVEVATACVDLKKEAKARRGSFLFVDRRTTALTQ
jgi:PleD family two-component response regulator